MQKLEIRLIDGEPTLVITIPMRELPKSDPAPAGKDIVTATIELLAGAGSSEGLRLRDMLPQLDAIGAGADYHPGHPKRQALYSTAINRAARAGRLLRLGRGRYGVRRPPRLRTVAFDEGIDPEFSTEALRARMAR